MYTWKNSQLAELCFCMLMIVSIFTCGCSSKKIRSEEAHIHETMYTDQCGNLGKTLTFLISDGSTESLTQVIQCTDSTVKHGFAYVISLCDQIEDKDIIWQTTFDIDGQSFPVEVKALTANNIITVSKIIMKLESLSGKESYYIRDDYQYIFYIDNDRVFTISPGALDLVDTPKELKEIVNEMLSLGSPLYPNYGFINFVE